MSDASNAPEPQVIEAEVPGVVLVVVAPFYQFGFDPSIEGVPVVTRTGTVVPAPLADEVIASAANCGVSIERRS